MDKQKLKLTKFIQFKKCQGAGGLDERFKITLTG